MAGLAFAAIGAALFWLLSEGMISHSLANIGMPLCFLGAAAAVVVVAIKNRRG